MNLSKDMVILGPKHSGKTSAGRCLANLMGSPFYDLDDLIEARTGKSPRALFREGPEVFRRAEAETLADLGLSGGGSGKLRVIAAGGGIIDNPQAMEVLGTGEFFLITIEVSPDTAWARIASPGKELPPFLEGPDPREIHRELHERRAAAYRDLGTARVSGEDSSPEAIGNAMYALYQAAFRKA